MSFLQSLNVEKMNKILILGLSLLFSFFGILLLDLFLLKAKLGDGNPKTFFLFVFGFIWILAFLIFLFIKTESRLKLYIALMFTVYTFLYHSWIVLWGFSIHFPLLPTWNSQLYFFTAIIVLICFAIHFNSKKFKTISKFFQKNCFQEIFILFLFCSTLFLITIDVYDTRNPAESHEYYFNDRNIFPPDYRILIPSFVEVGKAGFKILHLDYLANIQRLYKVYILVTLTLGFYLYYFFLSKFFKKLAALMISTLLLLMFYISFRVGGLVDDPFNLLAFVIGLMLIYYRKYIYLWLLIFIGSFNKETIWFLGLMYFVHNLRFINKKNWWKIFGKTFILAVTFIGVVLFRILLKPIHGTDFNWIIYNFTCEQCVLHVFLILNIFWILSFFFAEYPKQLKFFSRLNFITPIFVAWHYFGLIREFRFFIIIGLILLPLGVSLLFPDSVLKKENSDISYLST